MKPRVTESLVEKSRGKRGVSHDPNARAKAARESGMPSGTVRAHDDAPPETPSPGAKPLRFCASCGKTKGRGGECDCLVKTVSCTIVKPLDRTWDEVGSRLRDVKGSMHRLLNAGIRQCLRSEDQSGKAVAQAARDGVKAALAEERRYWTERVGKAAEGTNHDPEKPARMSEFSLPSVIEDAVAGRAAKMYSDARKHMARGDKSIPSVNHNAPIYWRDGDGAWGLESDDRGYTLALKLFPGRCDKTRFAVRVHGGSAHSDMRRIARGDGVKLGDARVVKNERTGDWEARLCYTFPRPAAKQTGEVVAVHRGVHAMLTLAATTAMRRDFPGDGFLESKNRFRERRKKLASHVRHGELGGGARGRGRARRYKSLTTLDDAEARMMKSACQQAAAEVVRFAQHPNVNAGVVLIEDYQTIRQGDEERRFMPTWPWAQLKGAVAWACEKAGLELVEVPSEYISRTCPACSHVDPASVRGRSFECVACGFDWGVDAVASFNMLRIHGRGDAVDRMCRALQSLARSARERKKRDEAAE